nr:phosphoadenylyl-sulfate reductase [Paraflavitalea speifideiaquila]
MNTSLQNYIPELTYQSSGLNMADFLSLLARQFPGQVTFSTSFSFEDQVIAHEILSHGLPISVFTLDTGRLFAETYSVWSSTNARYQSNVKAYYPDNTTLEKFVQANGPNAFYESVENRKQCCYIRKVEPLKRALKDNAIWITGLRAEHSPDRNNLSVIEWDEGNQLIKYNPILH